MIITSIPVYEVYLNWCQVVKYAVYYHSVSGWLVLAKNVLLLLCVLTYIWSCISAMYTMLSSTLMNFLTIIQEDVDREVTMATLESLAEVIEKIGDPVVQYSGMTDRIISTVKTVLQEKVKAK